VLYPNSNFNSSERTILSATAAYGAILSGDSLSSARGKYFGCEVTAVSGSETVIGRSSMYFVSQNAAILNTALSASWSPLKLKGTVYTVTLNANKGSSPRAISKILIGLNANCETSNSCNATSLSLISGTTSSGNWSGTVDFGRVLDGNESLTIYLYDTDNRIMAIGPRINQWGVVITP